MNNMKVDSIHLYLEFLSANPDAQWIDAVVCHLPNTEWNMAEADPVLDAYEENLIMKNEEQNNE